LRGTAEAWALREELANQPPWKAPPEGDPDAPGADAAAPSDDAQAGGEK